MILPVACDMIILEKNLKKNCVINKEGTKILNDKYPFEACATGRYPLRHVLLGVTLWGNITTGKACFQSQHNNNVVMSTKWDWV